MSPFRKTPAKATRRELDLRDTVAFLRGDSLFRKGLFLALERATGYHLINRYFSAARSGGGDVSPGAYFGRQLEELGITVRAEGIPKNEIPATGPVVFAANHPFGGADAMALGNLALTRRPDTRILANEFIGSLEPLRKALIPVDVFGGPGAARKNLLGMRAAARHLDQGGALVIFPAGEVAHRDWGHREIEEQPWKPHVARLARRGRATVIPVYFEGRNSLFFQALGLLHPYLRTAWLARELLGLRGRAIRMKLGRPMPPDPAWETLSDEALAARWRSTVLSLGN